ncbi:MAG: hypothetical protein JWN61_897, partial [Pseudonocardiales bacterium]|nr:hypothetical protein [Pseudonocardiales bacterium]
LPHFIVGYSASGDVFTRALPVLVLILLAELPIDSRLGDRPGGRIITPVIALLTITGVYVLVNRTRGRRLFQLPNSVGRVELAVFVLAPALVHYALKQILLPSIGLAVLNVVLLGLIYAWTSYAVLPVLIWALGQAARQLGDVLNLLMKSLPLLLLFVIFAFVNADTFSMASAVTVPLLCIALGIVVAVGTLFLIVRTPRELRALSSFADWAEVETLCIGTPAESVAPASPAPPDELALSWRERVNLSLLIFLAQAVQVVLVTLAVGGFFLVLGLFLIPTTTIAQWGGLTPEQLVDHKIGPAQQIFGTEVVFTRELLIVASFVAVISGLQFLVAALTDQTYRAEFTGDLVDSLRKGLAVRALYRDALVLPI